jgi:hypothetical protein
MEVRRGLSMREITYDWKRTDEIAYVTAWICGSGEPEETETEQVQTAMEGTTDYRKSEERKHKSRLTTYCKPYWQKIYIFRERDGNMMEQAV